MPRLSEHAKFTLLDEADIGGTSANSGWLSMEGFNRALGYVEIGTWDSGDDLDECRFQQGTDSSGTSAKDLTTDASAGDYDTDNPVDADGNFVILEVLASDLDSTNSFDHIRLYLAEGGNSGVDTVKAFVVRYEFAYPQKQLNGAASTGAQVYVDSSTQTG